ncbi:restriction endonuclease subunit S [uncultured Subdoligranulum sp.]|uniref:restriction endonuclease subunit S n=1 Tax=uncultured Subdoligranulum sp. TaxID=512298 RepID=UPI002601557E|nr:restriction endonuclease subunit S [uncultured Subdoligranulum sp.]
MREMKGSGIEWIGEIPKSWTITILSALFSEHKCKNSGLTENNLLSLSYGNIVRKNIESNEGLLPTSFETYNIIEPGNIVFRLTDLQNDKRSLRTGLCQERGIITSAYVTLQIRSNDSPRYMHYLFHTYDLCKVFYGMGDGVRQGMNYEDLKRLRILRPDQETQRRIADYLDRKCSQIDAIIARQQEVIEKLKAYKLSVITEAVTKGLNPDVPMKESGVEWIGEIPDFWNVVPLKTCADILPGYAFSSDDFDIENGTALLRGINVTPNGIRWEDVVYWNNPITEQLRTFELVAGDIVVGLDRPWVSGGTRVCWVTQKDLPALLLQRVCRIRAKVNIDSRWIYHWIASKSFQEALSIETTGVSVPHISTKQIEQFSITLPPIEVQHQICDTLEVKCYSVGNVIDKKQAIIDKLTQYKKSLIYEVVTGKKEV